MLDPLHFHINFRISMSISIKEPPWILIGFVFSLQIHSEIILNLLILEHGMSIYLDLQFSSALFFYISTYMTVLYFFDNFIPKCFIPFHAIINRIIFLISCSDCSLLVHRNTIDLYILILYPATLMNLFISSSNIFVDSLGFSTYRIMSSANKEDTTSFFPRRFLPFLFLPFSFSFFPFLSFLPPFLTALARVYCIMLNRSGES